MKKVTKEIVTYVSDDGKSFKDMEDCMKHEKKTQKYLELTSFSVSSSDTWPNLFFDVCFPDITQQHPVIAYKWTVNKSERSTIKLLIEEYSDGMVELQADDYPDGDVIFIFLTMWYDSIDYASCVSISSKQIRKLMSKEILRITK